MSTYFKANTWIHFFHCVTHFHVIPSSSSGFPLQPTFYDYRDNEAPVFMTRNIGDIKEGVCFKISGYMAPNCERFAIHLMLDNEARDIALRVNPRLPQNYVVRNSRVNNIWGVEEDASVLPFTLKRGTEFFVQILITDDRYMISLNGYHFAKFNHRVHCRSLACIEVLGDVSNINVYHREVMQYPDSLPELQTKCIRVKPNNQIIDQLAYSRITLRGSLETSLSLPYYGLLGPKRLAYGTQLRFEGRVKLLPWSFYINLQAGQNIWPHPIVGLHLRCRFARHRDYIGKNVVTRNAWYNGEWAKEEVSELTTDLCPAKNFSLVIVRGLVSYQVFVNKKFITEFRFRIDPDIADTVYVLGDIKLWDVVLEDHDLWTFL